MPNTLTKEELQLQQATTAGDWETYQRLFEEYKKIYANLIPIERLLLIFIMGEQESTLLTLSKQIGPTDFEKKSPKAKVLTHLLRELSYANLGNLFHFMQAISSFRLETVHAMHTLLKKNIYALQKVEDRKALATALLRYCLEKWMSDPQADPEMQREVYQEKEKILISLMDAGAVIPEKRYLDFMINHNMTNALKHKAVGSLFQRLEASEQRIIMDKCVDEARGEALEIFIKLASDEARALFKKGFDTFVHHYLYDAVVPQGLVAISADPVRHAEFQKKMETYGLLIKYDLVSGFDQDKKSIDKLEQAFLRFDDPTTNKSYKLLEFIEHIPALDAGWKALKKETKKHQKVKEHYQIVKATLDSLGSEIRSEAELEEARKSPESEVVQESYTYNLIDIQQFLKENPTLAEHFSKALGLTRNTPTVARKHKANAIVVAAKNGDWETVEKLITAKVDVNVVDGLSKTALHYAASAGKLNILEMLLNAGASVAVKDKQDKTPLHYASSVDNVHILQKLIEAGALVDARDEKGRTPLHYAASEGLRSNIQKLLEAGAGQFAEDKEGKQPILYAVFAGKLNSVVVLLGHASHIGNLSSVVNFTDKMRKSLLHYAVEENRIDILHKLLKDGAAVYATDKNGKTPLHYAAREGNLEAVDALIKAGAQVNAKDSTGETPLHDAVGGFKWIQHGFNFIEKLIEAGADIEAEDDKNKTPKDYANSYASQSHPNLRHVAYSGEQLKQLLFKISSQTELKADVPQITKNFPRDNDFPKLREIRNQYVACLRSLNALDEKLMNLYEYTEGMRDDIYGVIYEDRRQGIEKCDEELLSVRAEIRRIEAQNRDIPNKYPASSVQNAIRRLSLIYNSHKVVLNKSEKVYNYSNKLWANIERIQRVQTTEPRARRDR